MNPAFFDIPQPTALQKVKFTTKKLKVLNFHVKRDDMIDSEVSGNKWRKLKFNIKYALDSGFEGIASFGGAFSNHIAALAAAGNRAGVPTMGFIRTHQLDLANPTLRQAERYGMKLVAMSRETYRLRNQPEFLSELSAQYPGYFLVPEGGSNDLANPGLEELANELRAISADYICCAIGSGGTLTGLMQAMPEQAFIGVPVVKDKALQNRLKQQFGSRLTLLETAYFGGYGKLNDELESFCLDFIHQTGIPIEPVYTGKMFFALCQYLTEQATEPTPSICAIHTGGLQGINGLIYRHQIQAARWQKALALTAV